MKQGLKRDIRSIHGEGIEMTNTTRDGYTVPAAGVVEREQA
jgi:hypothetical protein